MPIYEYLCQKCNNIFEVLDLFVKEDTPICPTCGGDRVKRLISPSSVRPDGIATGSGGFDSSICKNKDRGRG